MTLPYDEVGSGPAVVLLHAGVADRGMWSEHLEPVALAGYRVVAVDLPGFGEAPVGEGANAPWDDVLQTMDALGIDSAALIGNSFGGAVALRAAVIAPTRFWALVLISAPAPGLTPSPQLEAAWEAEESALVRGDVDGAVDAVVSAWTLPDSDASVRERVGAMQRRAFALQANADPGNEAPDPLEENGDALRALEIPTLVAAGDRDLPDFRDGAQLLAEALPRARHVVIEAAGHLAPLETPAEFRRLVLEFLGE